MAPAAQLGVSGGPVVGSGRSLAAVLLLALASLLPVGLAGNDAGLASHLALAPLFAASIRGEERIGPVSAFLAGLVVDVLTLAPLGVCAAAYLAFHAIAVREASSIAALPPAGRLLVFAPMALVVAGIHVATMVLIAGSEPTEAELAVSLGATVAAYPLLMALARLIRRSPGPGRAIRG